ncbi:hypothetical protein [Chromatocurvus halotolerans]|uniref:Chemotaxis protein CheZ n=1 Tax=Chromatocurvus halotolerans TaxID=1132028 RepID=A0A4R2LBA8_9GAMM|nr:hypothetical protein [Chromatocurvus halotolerans]TCO76575.1 hypothetical protein EV688_10429 [Chromatocurvus halotolerans]
MSDSGRTSDTSPGAAPDSGEPARARATDVGIAPEIRACNELGALLANELAEVEQEIERVTGIISEGATALSTSFDQLHRLASHERHEPQSAAAEELELAISTAIRALQFEDIATQALAEALRSVSYLRGVADQVETVHDAGELATRISEQHRIWSKMRRKAVLQKNLDQGSVDLF